MTKARVSTTPPSGMNQTEQRFADMLELRKRAGEIVTWRFEAVRFILASKCSYTPDFEVVESDGALTYYEVKGFWRDDARVKIKAAARLFSDRRFVAVQWKQKQWQDEEIKP